MTTKKLIQSYLNKIPGKPQLVALDYNIQGTFDIGIADFMGKRDEIERAIDACASANNLESNDVYEWGN
jgi:hypothetical protein